MIRNFGTGLLTPGHAPGVAAALACVFGAALWVLCCTRGGIPVSTSHSIVGAIIGVFIVAFGTRAFQWNALGSRILMPLLISPVAALLITALVLRTARTLATIHVRLASTTKTSALLAAGPTGSAFVATLSQPSVRARIGGAAIPGLTALNK